MALVVGFRALLPWFSLKEVSRDGVATLGSPVLRNRQFYAKLFQYFPNFSIV
jgi:hypothetical protein